MTRLRLPDPERCRGCGERGRIVETRGYAGYRRRRYACLPCGHRWTSYEMLVNPRRLLARSTPPPAPKT